MLLLQRNILNELKIRNMHLRYNQIMEKGNLGKW